MTSPVLVIGHEDVGQEAITEDILGHVLRARLARRRRAGRRRGGRRDGFGRQRASRRLGSALPAVSRAGSGDGAEPATALARESLHRLLPGGDPLGQLKGEGGELGVILGRDDLGVIFPRVEERAARRGVALGRRSRPAWPRRASPSRTCPGP